MEQKTDFKKFFWFPKKKSKHFNMSLENSLVHYFLGFLLGIILKIQIKKGYYGIH